jgi:negative regulator of replication initiation
VTRKVDEFRFQTSGEAAAPEIKPTPSEVTIQQPVTVRRLYEHLKLKPEAIISDLFSLGCTFRLSTDVVPDEIAKEVALRQGVILHILDSGDESPPTVPPQRVPPAPPTAPATIIDEPPQPRQAERDYETELSSFLDSGRFPRHANAVRKYLSILQWVIESFPHGRALLLAYRRGKASRRYFAKSESEIYEHASSPNPHRIGGAGLWALTTMDTRSKREVLDDILRACEISLPVRQKAIAEIK